MARFNQGMPCILCMRKILFHISPHFVALRIDLSWLGKVTILSKSFVLSSRKRFKAELSNLLQRCTGSPTVSVILSNSATICLEMFCMTLSCFPIHVLKIIHSGKKIARIVWLIVRWQTPKKKLIKELRIHLKKDGFFLHNFFMMYSELRF